MKIIKLLKSNKVILIIPLIVLVTAVVLSYAYKGNDDTKRNTETADAYPSPSIKTAEREADGNQEALQVEGNSAERAEITANTAKVVLDVEGMSCSGCISTIKSSLAGYEGIQDIIVNISGGTTEIYYDTQKNTDASLFASSVTASGYPATVKRILTADQLREEESAASQRAKFYIATVGGWDISRADFEIEMELAKNQYQKTYGQDVFSEARGQKVLDSIKAQITSRLINEGIQMQEVQRAGFSINPEIFEQEFDNLLMQKNVDLEKFKSMLAQSGYPFDYFMKKFENRVLLRHYLEEQVLRGVTSDFDKQEQYSAWFNNARALSKVTIYDKQLERLTLNQSAGGGCGSTCKS